MFVAPVFRVSGCYPPVKIVQATQARGSPQTRHLLSLDGWFSRLTDSAAPSFSESRPFARWQNFAEMREGIGRVRQRHGRDEFILKLRLDRDGNVTDGSGKMNRFCPALSVQ